MRLSGGLVVVLASAAVVAAASAGDVSTALRTSAYPDTSLPAAFSSAKLVAKPVPAAARAHGAFAAVEADVNGPDPSDGVLFVVFKTPQGAAASVAAVLPSTPGLALKPAGTVPGLEPGAMYTGALTTTDAINQTTTRTVTYVVAQQGAVLVAGFTSTSYAHKGNAAGAAALTRSGLAHLKAVSG
jgi:hypothetical protein